VEKDRNKHSSFFRSAVDGEKNRFYNVGHQVGKLSLGGRQEGRETDGQAPSEVHPTEVVRDRQRQHRHRREPDAEHREAAKERQRSVREEAGPG
jgi:hypothetical protein